MFYLELASPFGHVEQFVVNRRAVVNIIPVRRHTHLDVDDRGCLWKLSQKGVQAFLQKIRFRAGHQARLTVGAVRHVFPFVLPGDSVDGQCGEELCVVAGFGHPTEKHIHGIGGIHIADDFPKQPHLFEHFGFEEEFFFSGTGF